MRSPLSASSGWPTASCQKTDAASGERTTSTLPSGARCAGTGRVASARAFAKASHAAGKGAEDWKAKARLAAARRSTPVASSRVASPQGTKPRPVTTARETVTRAIARVSERPRGSGRARVMAAASCVARPSSSGPEGPRIVVAGRRVLRLEERRAAGAVRGLAHGLAERLGPVAVAGDEERVPALRDAHRGPALLDDRRRQEPRLRRAPGDRAAALAEGLASLAAAQHPRDDADRVLRVLAEDRDVVAQRGGL